MSVLLRNQGKIRIRLKWLLVPFAFLLVFVAVRAYQQRGMAEGDFPPVILNTFDGQPVDVSSFRGKKFVVYFWATWCPVCKVQRSAVESVAADHTVLTILLPSDDVESARDYFQSMSPKLYKLADISGEVSRRAGVRGVPAMFFVDENMKIRFREVGYTTGWGIRLRLWLL